MFIQWGMKFAYLEIVKRVVGDRCAEQSRAFVVPTRTPCLIVNHIKQEEGVQASFIVNSRLEQCFRDSSNGSDTTPRPWTKSLTQGTRVLSLQDGVARIVELLVSTRTSLRPELSDRGLYIISVQ